MIEITFLYFEYNNLYNIYIKYTKSSLEESANLISSFISKNGIKNIFEMDDIIENRITIIRKDGKVIFDSYKSGNEDKMDSHLYREEVQESFSRGEGFSVRYSNTIKRKLIYYSKIASEKYIVRMATDYSNIIERIRDVIYKLILFFFILDVVLINLYNSMILEFFYKKIKSIKQILEKGKPVSEIFFQDDKLLYEFWQVIKDWQNSNLQTLTDLEIETEKLKEIISSVDIGILSITENDEIILKNEEVENNFMKYKNNGQYYECIKYIEIIKFINELKNDKKNKREEITLNDVNKHYVVTGKYLKKRGIYIITIKDVTKDREFSEIQKRFITNISHELKTPLTNIKGYLIAIKEEKDEGIKNNFLQIATRNLDKIENMIQDFLSISKAENSRVVNSYQYSVKKLSERIIQSLNGLVKSRNAEVKIGYSLFSDDVFMNIDSEKILPVLKNLIENGIIYNNSEIPEVKLFIKEDKLNYAFTIKDNGIGISKDETTKIFERFYRVDKSRTQNVAGTGLGLSIVDEIIKIYGGKINIESEIGKGTTIKLIIPKN